MSAEGRLGLAEYVCLPRVVELGATCRFGVVVIGCWTVRHVDEGRFKITAISRGWDGRKEIGRVDSRVGWSIENIERREGVGSKVEEGSNGGGRDHRYSRGVDD